MPQSAHRHVLVLLSAALVFLSVVGVGAAHGGGHMDDDGPSGTVTGHAADGPSTLLGMPLPAFGGIAGLVILLAAYTAWRHVHGD